MDPVTHTLVGASLAESGLKRRTALGTATLLIGANFPDVDVAALFWGGESGLWFRRGVTHGLLAMLLLPPVLTTIMVVWGWLRRRGSIVEHRGRVRPGQILLLATIAIATHPVLDFLNVYGMRWLMPFSERWFYADTLFIVDPWVWAVLAGGIWFAKRRSSAGSKRPAGTAPRMALLLMVVYIGVMFASNLAARRQVANVAREQGIVPLRMMVAPVAVNPLRRWVVVEDTERYHVGELHWLRRPMLELAAFPYETRPSSPAAAAALRGPKPRQFLSWARFPYFGVEVRPDDYLVRIGDARYTIDPVGSWAATEIVIDRLPGSP